MDETQTYSRRKSNNSWITVYESNDLQVNLYDMEISDVVKVGSDEWINGCATRPQLTRKPFGSQFIRLAKFS